MHRSHRDRHLIGLVAAFALVASAFLGAALLTQHAITQIDDEVSDMQINSLPSVTQLSRARTTMGHLLPEIEALADGPPSEHDATRDRIARLRGQVDAEIATYEQTPWYAGERAVFEEKLLPALDQFDRDLGHLTALDPAGERHERVAAEQHLVLDADATDEALANLLQVNQDQAWAASSRILTTRERAVQMAVVLEILSSLVAFVAAWLAIRASRRFGEVLQHNAALQTARADEFEGFAQRVAHDLLSPISGVVFSLGALERAHPDAETREIVKRTLRSLARSRQMVHGIFNFARSGARSTPGAHAALGAGIRAAVEELATGDLQSIPAIETEPFEDCEVACDEAVLGVMLSNLLGNAEKFTRDSPVRRIVVRAALHASSVRVEVEDTGPGLAPGVEHAIFEPYVRATGLTQPGLGLGLATVKRLAESHGGGVGVRRTDAGSVFWFEIPRAGPSVVPSSRPPRRPSEGAPADA
ncbi:MAG TPA: ATP-binding protein [Polyangiaceae bacterium]|jgi:signal transduction histidine kinase